MQHLFTQQLAGRSATIAHSTRADGDLSPSVVEAETLHERRAAALDLPWTTLRQVHSDRVIRLTQADAASDRPVGDALVTAEVGQAIVVHVGDCAPVGFVHGAGAIGVAHAGWAGLEAGVLEATVRSLRDVHGDDDELVAVIGPHIRADRYEFGSNELARLARRFGDHVVSTTASGAAALDLTAAVTGELAELDVSVVAASPDCTAALEDQYWSHRARKERGRIALVAWLEETAVDEV